MGYKWADCGLQERALEKLANLEMQFPIWKQWIIGWKTNQITAGLK